MENWAVDAGNLATDVLACLDNFIKPTILNTHSEPFLQLNKHQIAKILPEHCYVYIIFPLDLLIGCIDW